MAVQGGITAVTGATGHIGANLVRELLRSGRRLRVLVERAAADDTRAIDGLEVERVVGDVRDRESLLPLLQGADVVYHLAAVIALAGDRAGRLHATNVIGAENVAELAREAGVRRMVHFSSIHAFSAEPAAEPIDEKRSRALGPAHPAYDRSKAEGEERVRAQVARGLDVVVVNPTGVIGPWDFAPSRFGRLLLAFHRREVPALVAGGFDWVDARDVAASALAAERDGRTGESYLLGGRWHSMLEIARIAESVTGVRAPRRVVPTWLARAAAPFSTLAARFTGNEPLFTSESLRAANSHRHVVSEKAARELGHRPRPIAESIADSYAWFAEAGFLSPPA
jgi:dihydroflavonol-4-reductase